MAKYRFTTLREMVEEVRDKLLRDVRPWWKDSPLNKHLFKQFGPTLTERDGLIDWRGVRVTWNKCHICGECPDVDEEFLQIIGIEGDLFNVSINICPKCLKEVCHGFKIW